MSLDEKRNEQITLQDAEEALRATLRNSANLFPKTLEDVENILKQVDIRKVTSPDLNKFRVSLRRRPAAQIPRLPAIAQRPEEDVVEDLRAARNGNKLSNEVLARMRADREAAEKEELG
jgi:hypothetical protein